MSECLPDLFRYVRQRDNEWQGADHPNGPWRSIPAPQSGLPWLTDGPAVPEIREPASVAADVKRSLSPAAQAVMDAIEDVLDATAEITPRTGSVASAALRAAVEQAVPEPPDCGTPTNDYVRGLEDRQRMVRFWLLSIAAELENQ